MLRGGTPSAAPSARPVAMGVGLVAGVASTVAHSGGVVLGLYLVGRPLSSAGVVATGTLAYAMSDVVKVGTYAAIGWVTPPLLLATVAATPFLYLGSWLGYRLNARLPAAGVRADAGGHRPRRRAPSPAELRSHRAEFPARPAVERGRMDCAGANVDDTSSPLKSIMKWVGIVAAVLSLIAGVRQFLTLSAESAERERRIGELLATGAAQQQARDYPQAWTTLETALAQAEQGNLLAKLTRRLGERRQQVRAAQENLAMQWLQNISVPQGQTFASVVDKVLPVLHRGALEASGTRVGDLYAHVGWGYFLKRRDGQSALDPAPWYAKALESRSRQSLCPRLLGSLEDVEQRTGRRRDGRVRQGGGRAIVSARTCAACRSRRC